MRFLLFLSLTVILSSGRLRAQESMMKDIDHELLDELVRYAKENYPRIMSNQHRIKMAQANIIKAHLSYFDFLTFSYLFAPTNTTTPVINPVATTSYQYGLFLNVGYLVQKPAQVRYAREEKKSLEYEKLAYDQNVEMEIRKRYLRYVQQKSMLRSRTQARIDANSALKEIKYRFERGEETFDNYNKALVVLEDHNQKVIEAEGAMLVAKAEVEEFLGKKLEDFE